MKATRAGWPGLRMPTTNSLVEQIVCELDLLGQLGYWHTSGAEFFEQCESIFVHPEHEDSRLAWALRISAGVYYPAYLVLAGKLPLEKARVRIAENVFRIQFISARQDSFNPSGLSDLQV